MTPVVYILCFGTSTLCAWLLLKAFRRTRVRLLLWSGLCFCCMGVNNLLLFLDLHVFPDTDLMVWRLTASLAGIALLLFGLVWEPRR